MSTISPAQKAAAEIAEQYRLKEEEKEKLALQNEKEIENLKKGYELEKATLTDRFEQSVQYDKTKYYENVRNQKRSLQRAEDDLSQKKNEVIGQREAQLQKEQLETELTGKKTLDQTKQKNAMALDYETKTAQETQDLAKKQYKNSAKAIVSENESKIGDLYAQKSKELELASARNKEAVDQMHQTFQSQQTDTQGKYASQLKSDQSKIQKDLNARRLNNAQQLSAYSVRQNDPFYQMVKPDAEISETKEGFVLRVRVPEHERDQFKVQIAGQEIQLTGIRSNNEKAEVAPGNWVSTSTYQNYTERYPLSTPVDAKTLVVSEDGEWMQYEIMKFGPHHRQNSLALQIEKDKQANTVTNVDFPSTLPKASNILKKSGPPFG